MNKTYFVIIIQTLIIELQNQEKSYLHCRVLSFYILHVKMKDNDEHFNSSCQCRVH